MEIYSLVQKKNIDGYRNGFCNLALPVFQIAEPIKCETRKYKDYVWSNWDKILIKDRPNITLKELIDFINDSYDVDVEMISYGPTLIYSMFTSASKLKERMPKTIPEVISLIRKKDDVKSLPVISLDFSCSDKDGNEVTLPPVRLSLH